jgi:Ca2+-binding RTX toxin-like protein
MQPRLTPIQRLALPAALLAAGLALSADPAAAAKPGKDIDVSIRNGTLEIVGSSDADKLALRIRAGKPGKLEIDAGDDGKADFRVKRRRFERIAVEVRGGADLVRIDDSNGAFTDVTPTTIDGGSGDDTLLGGRGAEVLIGGDGDDDADGNQGNDVAFLGAGDDGFTWDPGDGSDVVEGRTGQDELVFNGSGANESFDVSANGERVRFFRNVGSITMDLDGVERIDTNAVGGADIYSAGDLSGTDVTELDTDLAGALGGAAADGQPDDVILAGTDGADAVEALGSGENAAVVGLPALVRIRHAEPADDLVVNALAGDDTVSASTLQADAPRLTADGGNGDDELFGGRGRDILLGGDGDDLADGNQADDVAFLGAGQDAFRWDPGDGSDVVEGQAGEDALRFNGSGANELFDVSANGQRVRFFRNVANIVMDLDDVERIETNALGGADTLTVNDVSGTDLAAVAANLGAALGATAGDAQADTVIVNATNGDDAIAVAGAAGAVDVTRLQAAVAITGAEADRDRLEINGRAGADTLDTSGLAANTIGLTFTQ